MELTSNKVILTPQELFELKKELTLAVLASPNLTGSQTYIPNEVTSILGHVFGIIEDKK